MFTRHVFISHDSACRFWAARDSAETEESRCVPGSRGACAISSLEALRQRLAGVVATEGGEIHVSVATYAEKRRVPGVVFHVRTAPFPPGSFRSVGGGVFVASPELCFLQAAVNLPFHSLVMHGLELCGTYARISGDAVSKRAPLTTVRRIERHLSESSKAHGVKGARAAAAYLIDGSASVRESALVASLTLPCRLGGFALPRPQMNHPIEVDRRDPSDPRKKLVLHGDLVWPDARLVVEYDGARHAEDESRKLDRRRDHLLLDAGYEVVRIADDQMRSSAEMERLARTINRKGGFGKRKDSLHCDAAKMRTLRALMFDSQTPWSR